MWVRQNVDGPHTWYKRRIFPQDSRARLAYAPDYPQGIPAEQAQGLLQAIEEGWGKGVAFEALVASRADNASMKSWWARYQRLAASPGAAVRLLQSAFETDAHSVLPTITVPVLVLHRTGDPFTGPEHGRYLAERVPGMKFVELSGIDHLFFAEDMDLLLSEIQEFLIGVLEAQEPDLVLATIMFVDIVGSTDHATRLGDRQWRDVLDRYYAIARRQLVRSRGREIAVRVGIPSGECEVIGDYLRGIAVHTGARIAGQAGPSEVLVSSTVMDLVAGSGIRFEDRGRHPLKGVPGEWSLFAVAADRKQASA